MNSSAFGQFSSGGVPPSSTYNIDYDRNITELFGLISVMSFWGSWIPDTIQVWINLPVNFSPETVGNWIDLENGGRLWRLTIRVDGALALSACFDKFHILPEGNFFSIISIKRRLLVHILKRIIHQKIFCTELLKGDQLTLEYYQPTGSSGDLRLHLNEIVYAYRESILLEIQRKKINFWFLWSYVNCLKVRHGNYRRKVSCGSV